MPPSPPALLLALLLLGTASAAWAQSSPCQTGVRRLELEGRSAPPPELCISPGLTTALLFDRELASAAVELEGRSRFERVDSAGRSLLLLPSAGLSPGERLRLTVRYAGAEAPTSVTFVLVVHRAEAERQVEVSHAPPRSEACRAELERKEAELQRCLQAPASPPLQEQQGSLARLLEVDAFGRGGVTKRTLLGEASPLAPGTTLQVRSLKVHRIRLRLVMEVELMNHDAAKPWLAQGAKVRGPSGEELEPLLVLQRAPLPPGQPGRVWVELASTGEELQGSYTLQLWDAGQARSVTVPDLKLR